MSAFQQNFESLYGHLKTAQALNTVKEVSEQNKSSGDSSTILRIIGVGLITGVAVWIIYDLVKQNKERHEGKRF